MKIFLACDNTYIYSYSDQTNTIYNEKYFMLSDFQRIYFIFEDIWSNNY